MQSILASSARHRSEQTTTNLSTLLLLKTKNVKETMYDLRSTHRLLGRIRDPMIKEYF